MNSLLRLFAIMRKELLQLSRDRLTFGMIVGIPLIQLTLFGFAINTDVRNLRAGLVDEADTHLSRQLVADIDASQVLRFQYRVDSPQELEALLDGGRIAIGLYIPEDFDRRVIRRDRQAAQLSQRQPQQCALARAVRAGDADALAPQHIKRQVFKQRQIAE